MNETLFYALGIGLVVVAVLVAVIGLRFDKVPASKGLLVLGTAAFAALVVATGAFAWLNAEDEQEHREAELAEAAEETAAEGEEGQAAEEVGPDVAQDPTETASAEGAQLFEANGCGGCHTLAAAGSTGTTGPDLDGALHQPQPGGDRRPRPRPDRVHERPELGRRRPASRRRASRPSVRPRSRAG